MKYVLLFVKMLRYRVAIMLILFFLLGIAVHQSITHNAFNIVLGIIALVSSYVTATTINDIADKKIDMINHPKNKGRPLVSGEATETDMYIVHLLAIIIGLLATSLIGSSAIVVIVVSFLINYLYSLPPIQFSHKAYFAPVVLAFAYVVIPFWLGILVSKSIVANKDEIIMIALAILFCGRILLKDFRDRKGDTKFGKRTFLLVHGKSATIIVSAFCIVIGNMLLFFVFPMDSSILILLQFYFIAIYVAEYNLWCANTHESEQTMIGIGAKMGNGLLLTILGVFILQEYHASVYYQFMFTLIIVCLYMYNFLILLKNPGQAILGYKG